MIEREMGAGAWGLLAALSVLCGGSFCFAEVALTELPALTLVLGDRLTMPEVAGLALIGLGLAAIDGRPLSLLLRQSGRRSRWRASAT